MKRRMVECRIANYLGTIAAGGIEQHLLEPAGAATEAQQAEQAAR